MSHLLTRPASRRLAVAAVALGLVSGALPGAAHAGKAPKCDPTKQVCDTGRKNG